MSGDSAQDALHLAPSSHHVGMVPPPRRVWDRSGAGCHLWGKALLPDCGMFVDARDQFVRSRWALVLDGRPPARFPHLRAAMDACLIPGAEPTRRGVPSVCHAEG